MPYVEIRGVSKGFSIEGYERKIVLDGVHLEVPEGEFIAITGFSGSGKSTLLSLLSGDESPDRGEILLGGQSVHGPDHRLTHILGREGGVPEESVEKTLMDALRLSSPDQEVVELEARVRELLSECGLSERSIVPVDRLAQADRIRLSLAICLAGGSRLVLIDEPLNRVPAADRPDLQHDLRHALRKSGKTVILMTNDLEEAILMADRIFPLTRGPGATLGPGFPVPVHLFQGSGSFPSTREYQSLKRDIVDFLTGCNPQRHGSVEESRPAYSESGSPGSR